MTFLPSFHTEIGPRETALIFTKLPSGRSPAQAHFYCRCLGIRSADDL